MKILEILAFAVSVGAFTFGAFHLLRRGVPRFFQLYVCAAGCYMLEEVWVIVNSLLGNGSDDGLLTVRLVGFFGCLCFMLSANANEFDKVVDEGNAKKAKLLALIAPAVLLALYAVFVLVLHGERSPAASIAGFIIVSPALPASYFSFKHLLLPRDEMGFLNIVRSTDIAALVFYAANFIYPIINLYFSGTLMSICDFLLNCILFGVIIMCRRGAVKWKALI